ncbi:hypothetical protein M9H77_08402 [Catharanthus roseus]|uniref:Uncharacterized protein n=1 Tax=Catharanthus roseus TaxID=4058 RepID=A0ACC0BXP6_CATRO|nr:hypothetical protein M9H77_08402 [Catharanthus roseus]
MNPKKKKNIKRRRRRSRRSIHSAATLALRTTTGTKFPLLKFVLLICMWISFVLSSNLSLKSDTLMKRREEMPLESQLFQLLNEDEEQEYHAAADDDDDREDNGMVSEDPVISEPCLTVIGNLSSSLYGGLKIKTQVLLIPALVLFQTSGGGTTTGLNFAAALICSLLVITMVASKLK